MNRWHVLNLRDEVRKRRQLLLKLRAGLSPRRSGPSAAKALIVAPHPDDETFGMGGLIARLGKQKGESRKGEMEAEREKAEMLTLAGARAESKHGPHVVFLSSGDSAHTGCCGVASGEVGARREDAARKATSMLGVRDSQLVFFRLDDRQLPHPGQAGFDEVSDHLSELIRDAQPDSIFAPHPFEGWSDHIAAEEMAREAIRKAESRKQKAERRIELYHYCVWFWFSMPLRKALKVDWRNAVTLDISKVLEKKRAAMRVYLEDLAPCGNPYCGRLPRELLRAFEWDKELFFRVKR